MNSRELYTLLHLLEKFDAEGGGTDQPAHLAVTILKINIEKCLNARKEMG